MKTIIISLSLFLCACHVSINHGRNGILSPDRHIDSSITTVTTGVTEKLGQFEIDQDLEIAVYDEAVSASCLMKLRKEWKDFFIEAGPGIGYLEDNTPGIRKGLHGILYGAIGYKNFILGLRHGSNPLKHNQDGDVGLNHFFFGLKWNW